MPIDTEICEKNWMQYVWMRDNGHKDYLDKARKTSAFTAGQQWALEDLAALAAVRRPALTINKILPTLSTIAGEQIQNRVEVVFRPSSGAQDGVAEALTKVWMQISQNNQLPWVRSDVFWQGVMTGRGFYDVRADFSDSMIGEARIVALNPKNVLLDPEAESYDPDGWNQIIITKWLTWQDIAILYNEKDAHHLRDTLGTQDWGYDTFEAKDSFGKSKDEVQYANNAFIDEKESQERNIRIIERQYRKLTKQAWFVDVQSGDMRQVPETWDRNRIASMLERAQGNIGVIEKQTNRIRWTVTAGDVCLHDEWSPYNRFTVIPFFPYLINGKTVGVVEQLLSPQELLNKASSQELHIINTSANSGWIIESNSLANMTVAELESEGAKTGLVLEVKPGAQLPQKINPNIVPTGLDRITYKAEEHIKTISNVSDSMQGFDREDVAAKAIDLKQARGSINLIKLFDNLQRSDWLLARSVLEIVQQYYTEPRVLNITKDNYAQEVETLEVNQPDPVTGEIVNDLTLGEYNIIITSAPYRASMEDSQFEQAVALRQLGVQIDDSVLIENSRLMRRKEIVDQINAAKNSPEMQQQQQLQMRDAEAEIGLKEAQAQKTMVDASLTQVRAERLQSGVEDQIAMAGKQGDSMLQMQKQALEVEKLKMQLAKVERELQLKAAEIEMKQQESYMKMALDQNKAEMDANLAAQKLRMDQQARKDKADADQLARAQAFNQDEEEMFS